MQTCKQGEGGVECLGVEGLGVGGWVMVGEVDGEVDGVPELHI